MELSEHISQQRPVAESICQRLREEIAKLGFAATDIVHYPNYDEANFELIKDPYTGAYNLACNWLDASKRQRIGKLQFNSDGTFYAEYDVAKPHPTKPKRFIESVTAWGNAGQMKAEAKWLPMPE